jgi:Fic family protein
MPEVVTADGQAKQHYLVNSLMEEAIRSSQLEGASTSRHAAKELLRTGRPPRDRSERMIINNFLAMQYMREQMGDRLTPAAVLELQRILTADTFDGPGASGRLQNPTKSAWSWSTASTAASSTNHLPRNSSPSGCKPFATSRTARAMTMRPSSIR